MRLVLIALASMLPLDSEEIYSRAIQEVSDCYGGKAFTWELKVRQMGLVSADLAALVVKELELPVTADEYLAEVGPINVRLFPSANLMPGTCMTRPSGSQVWGRTVAPIFHFFLFILLRHTIISIVVQCLSYICYFWFWSYACLCWMPSFLLELHHI